MLVRFFKNKDILSQYQSFSKFYIFSSGSNICSGGLKKADMSDLKLVQSVPLLLSANRVILVE